MLHLTSIAEFRAACERARAQGGRVGLVPTMGYLHEGHRSLMRAARADCDLVAVTIFVNPIQFGANEDLDRYPRDLEGDLAQCEAEGVDVVFAPTTAEMYPDGPPLTTVHVARLTDGLCGAARPTHFDGVTTVVAKLFAITGACRAYFGRKDAQQVAVIMQMVDDLNFPVDVIGCPIVREADGLARSSRNSYLNEQERASALVVSRALEAAATAAVEGERRADVLVQLVRDTIATEPAVALEYAEARDARSLEIVGTVDRDTLLAVAARVGSTRLIDNVTLLVSPEGVRADLGRRNVAAAPRGSL